MINKVLEDLINTREVVSFINNIIVGIKEEGRYDKVVKEVVKRLAENDLYIKLKKYKWKVKEIEFLEVVIGLAEIKIEEEKMKSVLDQPTSKNIQKFLGLANYYQQFIKDFVFIARPLYNLVKKYNKWIFKKLKKKFTKELVLAVLGLDKKVRMEVVALKSLNKTERNYEIHDKKMLAVIGGLKNYGHLLESAKFKFKV